MNFSSEIVLNNIKGILRHVNSDGVWHSRFINQLEKLVDLQLVLHGWQKSSPKFELLTCFRGKFYQNKISINNDDLCMLMLKRYMNINEYF